MRALLFLLAAVSAYSQTDGHNEQVTDSLRRAFHLQQSGQYSAALTIFEGLVNDLDEEHNICKEEIGPRVLNSLGSVLQDIGRIDEAEKTYRRALACLTGEDAETKLVTAHVLANLGSLYFESRQFGRLRNVCHRVEQLLPDVAGQGAETARLTHLLGISARLSNDLSNAERYLSRALEIWRGLPEANQAAIGDALNSMGTIAFEQKDNYRALALFQEALKYYEAAGMKSQMPRAATLTNVACIYVRLRRNAEADTAFAKALEHARASAGTDHPYISSMLTAYAATLEQHGQKRRAKEHRARAAAMANTMQPRHVVDVLELQ